MFRGVSTAIITPFTRDYEIDYDSLERFIDFQLKYVDAIVVLGTTGEASTIDDYEREKIVSLVVEKVNKKIPVIVGTGSNNPKIVIKNNKLAEKNNADGLLIVTPYYNKATQNGLYDYFSFVSQNTILPIILYNVPSRTSVNMIPETATKLFQDNENIIGIKEASGDISQIAQLLSYKSSNMKVYSGNDDQTLPLMSLGGDGVISVAANVIPKIMKELTESIFQNNYEKARVINEKYNEFMRKMFIEINPITVKYAVSKLSYCENVLRMPLTEISQSSKLIIDEMFERVEMA
jgi:4-hydroxy-tetrahydrodipicolinate synthase